MAAMTMQERYAERLAALGETEVPSKSRKYRTFTRRKGGFYFLGRNGAVRYGRSSSRSLAASDGFKALLLAFVAGNTAGEEVRP